MNSLATILLSLVALMVSPTTSLYDFSINTLENEPCSLEKFKGKVVLVVNVASFCGYTPQYEALQALYTEYKDQGFDIAAFPSNDFGAQEPGTPDEIREFCSKNFGVTFPMFEKVVVKGDEKHPLYAWLTSGGWQAQYAGEIPWNFEKFLIDRTGNIVGRFNYKLSPEDASVRTAIEAALQGH